MNARRLRRTVALIWALLICAGRLILLRVRGPLSPVQRAEWLQSACRGALASLGFGYLVCGTPPQQGLVVSNHLSYLDILVYGAAIPCTFVAKQEVRRWPFFGRAARSGGTIFLDRSTRVSAAAVSRQIWTRLKSQIPVLLFPEGTTTDGSTVLRFHSTLFQPAVEAGVIVTTAALRYRTETGDSERELCWFGEEGFLRHLWQTLGAGRVTVEISFGSALVYTDRRAAAEATHTLVAKMRAQSTVPAAYSKAAALDAQPNDSRSIWRSVLVSSSAVTLMAEERSQE